MNVQPINNWKNVVNVTIAVAVSDFYELELLPPMNVQPINNWKYVDNVTITVALSDFNEWNYWHK